MRVPWVFKERHAMRGSWVFKEKHLMPSSWVYNRDTPCVVLGYIRETRHAWFLCI